MSLSLISQVMLHNSEKEKFSMFAHGNIHVILSYFLVYLL